ncbi:MAG: hypothetical protein CME64_02230 [Halobacteriovoraceae bacterium]|nr:hypothetical protein [Halobacteriovoraceae bacterium]
MKIKAICFLSILVFSSCSTLKRDVARVPANHLPEVYESKKIIYVFTGPGAMAAEYPIATSLKEIPVEVSFTNPLPNSVSCKVGEMGRFSKKTKYTLAPYSNGTFQTIFCKNDYDGKSEMPYSDQIEVVYRIQNRTKNMPFDQTQEYISYDKLLDELEDRNPSDELLGYVEDSLVEETHELNYENGLSFELDISSEAVELSLFDGKIKFDEGWFSSETTGPEGVEPKKRKKDTLDDPEMNAYELSCTLGDKMVKASEFEQLFFFDFNGKINCKVNLYYKYAKNEHEGSYKVLLKRTPLKKVQDKLEALVDDEELAHMQSMERIWQGDKSDMHEALKVIQNDQMAASDTFRSRVSQIKRKKYENKRDGIINSMFPEEVKGIIGRGVSSFKFTPVQKKYFLPNGKVKSKTYLLLSGRTDGLFKSPYFNFSFEYTPFGENINVYLYAEDAWQDGMKPVEMNVCLADKQNFYRELFDLQTRGNEEEIYIQDYMDSLSRYKNVGGVGSCVVFDSENSSLSRSEEFFWIGGDKDANDIRKIESFGAAYYGKFNELDLRHIYEVKGDGHPAKGSQHPGTNFVEEQQGIIAIPKTLDGAEAFVEP